MFLGGESFEVGMSTVFPEPIDRPPPRQHADERGFRSNRFIVARCVLPKSGEDLLSEVFCIGMRPTILPGNTPDETPVGFDALLHRIRLALSHPRQKWT